MIKKITNYNLERISKQNEMKNISTLHADRCGVPLTKRKFEKSVYARECSRQTSTTTASRQTDRRMDRHGLDGNPR